MMIYRTELRKRKKGLDFLVRADIIVLTFRTGKFANTTEYLILAATAERTATLLPKNIIQGGFLCYMVREHSSHSVREHCSCTNQTIRRIELSKDIKKLCTLCRRQCVDGTIRTTLRHKKDYGRDCQDQGKHF